MLNHSSLILFFFLNGHSVHYLCFQSQFDRISRAIPGLLNAMRCYSTFPAIINLIVSDNGYFQCYSTVEFLYLECLGIADFAGYTCIVNP